MKKKLIRLALLSCSILLTIACAPKKEEAQPVIDKEQIKKDIQAKENQFAELYNNGEMKNIGYYADDATTFPQNEAPLVGKPAIIEYLKAGIESYAEGNKITFTTNEVFVSSDVIQVVEIVYFNQADSTNVSNNTGN
jgi:ketosteroid isomerase-like protein